MPWVGGEMKGYRIVKYACIETKIDHWGKSYRFMSFYNGTRGIWRFNEKTAREDAARHKVAIECFHGLNTGIV